MRIKTAKNIVMREVTLTSNPADPNAAVRQQQESTAMPKDVQDQDRAALIQRCRAAHPRLTDEWESRMTVSGDVLTEEEVIADARETAAAIRAAKPAAVQIRTAAPANDDPAVTLERRAEALACHMTGAAPSDAARPFMGYGMADHARESLSRAGQSTRGNAEELLTRAMGTSDFPELLTASGNRVLMNAYQAAQSPLKPLARQRTAPDFRKVSVLKVAEYSGMQPVSEAGEIKAMTTGEAKEAYSLGTAGGIVNLTRMAMINDNLGAFKDTLSLMGKTSGDYEATQLFRLLTQNSGGGVKMDDGKNLFHADHGNLAAAGAALSETSLSAARLAVRTQKGLDGKTPVNVVPKYLLVGPALETTAEKLLASIYAATTDDVQPIRLSLLVEPRLTGNAWYVFGDPATAPVLEYAYLSSAPGPQLSSRDGWEVLGREFRVVLDFGCGAVDWRGAYRNAGA